MTNGKLASKGVSIFEQESPIGKKKCFGNNRTKTNV